MIVQYKPLVTTDLCNKCFLMLLTAFQNTTDKVFPFFNTEFFFTDRYIIFVVFKSYLDIRRLSA